MISHQNYASHPKLVALYRQNGSGFKKGGLLNRSPRFILLGRTASQHKITFQSRLTSNHARRDRKLCLCHWDAGEKCKYPSPERTPHMHPGVPSIALHLRVSILCQSCLFNTTLILSSFFSPPSLSLSLSSTSSAPSSVS